MKDHLKGLVELAGEHAGTVMIGLQKPLMPTWVLIDSEGKISILGTPWRDDREKAAYKIKMRKLMREKHIVAYSFVSEAWTVTRPLGWTPESEPGFVQPSNDPARREVVIAIATDGTNKEGASWAIYRGENEHVIALKQLDYEGGDLLGGMTEMLS